MKLLSCRLFPVASTMDKIKICETDFDVATEYEALRKQATQSGAIVFFVGLVRDLYDRSDETNLAGNTSDQSKKIDYIELFHYAGMTESLCKEIVDQARESYSLDAVRITHRVGKIYSSEQIVMVAVASSHRQQAFDACQFIMDYLKTRATLWKKEVGELGENWVGLKEKDRAASSRWS